MIDDLDDLDWLAAEYVLGTLDRDSRRRAEARIATDPAFAALVDAWELRLADLVLTAAPVDPPAEVWTAIAAALPAARPAAAPVVPPVAAPAEPVAPARDAAPEPTQPLPDAPATAAAVIALEPLRRQLRLWRGTGLVATALAAGLAAFIVLSPATRPSAPPVSEFVAVLDAGPGDAAWLVRIDTAELSIAVRPFGSPVVDAGAYQLWLLPEGGAPTSLGLLDPAGDVTAAVARDLGGRFSRTAALAVSLEPPGGSPTGLPTGPVLFQGKLVPVAP